SLNHYSYGAITGWLFSGVCGIRLQAGKLTLCPKPDRALGFAKAEWRSPVGAIRSSWRYEDSKLILDFKVPVPANIELPNGEKREVTEGEYHDEILL
ncbi:MAG: alpha-L-rhamnosidase, partial [Oscillospiraceae bacterium]|nr:alpha-L-rhamnosidase [Oscillospiraceae bacterium]